MSSLSPKDRVSLCSFTFADGRRCRTPRISSHPHFCYYHAQKEARSFAADKLGKDLDYFFSGDYLSACDLSTALARLIPAVIRGEVKPKTAHTVAYLFQTLMQAIHVSQHEYCEAFDTDDWRQAIRNSVNGNHDYRFPPDPQPEPPAPSVLRTNLRSETPQPPPQPAQPQSSPPQPQQRVEPPVNCHSDDLAQAFGPEESASSSNSPLATSPSFTASEAEGPLHQSPQPAPSPHPPLPPTSAEFVQQVMAGLHTGGSQPPQPASAPPQAQQPASAPPANPIQPTLVAQPFRSAASASDGASSPAQPQPQPHASQSVQTPINCHSERSEESASSSNSPLATSPSFTASEAEGPLPSAQPNNPPPTTPPTPPAP